MAGPADLNCPSTGGLLPVTSRWGLRRVCPGGAELQLGVRRALGGESCSGYSLGLVHSSCQCCCCCCPLPVPVCHTALSPPRGFGLFLPILSPAQWGKGWGSLGPSPHSSSAWGRPALGGHGLELKCPRAHRNHGYPVQTRMKPGLAVKATRHGAVVVLVFCPHGAVRRAEGSQQPGGAVALKTGDDYCFVKPRARTVRLRKERQNKTPKPTALL